MMVTSIPFWIIAILYAIKIKVVAKPAFVFNLFVLTFIVVLSFLENLMLTPGNMFNTLDESFFLAEAHKTLPQILSGQPRYLLFIIYGHLSLATSMFASGEWVLKVQSLPFSLLTLLILYDTIKKEIVLWLFPIVFGYIYMLSTLNMRDSMLICGTVLIILKLSKGGWQTWLWYVVASIFYFYIRPEFIVMILMVLLWNVWMSICYKNLATSLFAPFFLLIAIYVSPLTDSWVKYGSDMIWPGRFDVYLAERSEEVSEIPYVNENVAALIRQLATPFPTSKMVYLLTVGPTDNMVLKEIFRVILMTSVYFMAGMILLRPKRLLIILECSRFIRIMLMISTTSTIFYAIFGDGGGSTRNKIYPFLTVFMLFCSMYPRFLNIDRIQKKKCALLAEL